MLKSAVELLCKAEKISPDEARLPWIDTDEETKNFIDFWYDTPQKNDLRVLAYLISQQTDSLGNALRVAMSRLIITKNKGASLGGDISHSRPHRIRSFGENDFEVFQEFIKSCKWVAKRVHEIPQESDSMVLLGDARAMHSVNDCSVDAIVSSPPYLNAIDYLRGHKMSLVWLGFTVSELRDIRSSSVGASRRPAPDADMDLARGLIDKCNLKDLPPRLKAMILRYALDMNEIVREAARVTRPGGQVVYVVGNSKINGVLIENTEIVKAAAERNCLELNFTNERDIPASQRYLPPPKKYSDTALNKRMGTETVLYFTN
jgi:hypothetical protein